MLTRFAGMLKNCYVFLTPQPLVVRKIQESKCLKKKKKKQQQKKVLIITVFLSGQCCVLPEVVDVGTMVTVMAMLMVLKTVTLCHT